MSRPPIFLAIVAWLFALAAAVVPFAGLRALGVPPPWALGAAAAVALVLPLTWHLLAERRRALEPPSRTSPSFRLAWRAALVSGLVFAGALATTGPRPTWALVRSTWPSRHETQAPASPPPSHDGAAEGGRIALESLVPADASVVVSGAGAGPLRELFARARGGADAKLDALAKCGVRVDAAAWLVASRGNDRLIAARVPGADEERNVYCVAGVLADAGVRMTLAPDALTVTGLLGDGALAFRRLDRETLLLADEGWRADVERRAAGQTPPLADGPLRAAVARVDRGAPVWAVGELRSADSTWDLALDVKLEGGRWALRASSVSRDGERAEATASAPPAFSAVLTRGGLVEGAAGLSSLVAGAGGPQRPDGGVR